MNKKIIGLIIFIIELCIIFTLGNKQEYLNNDILLADVKVGDIDGNGVVNTADYILIRKYLIKQKTLDKNQLLRADVNGDNTVSTSDYIALRKIILGISIGLPYTSANTNIIESNYSYFVSDINVIDYGADPTGTKDSTFAFEKALSRATECVNNSNNHCGGTIYVPKGSYIIKKSLYVPIYVSIIGEAKEGSSKDGTIIKVMFGANNSNVNNSAFVVNVFSSIQNIVFWYPDQRIDSNGNATVYPPTIAFKDGTDGVTLENLYFVNSYTAIDLASFKFNNSIFFIRNIYGTALNTGIINDTNLDTIKMENINFSPRYWLESGLSNTPSSANLSKVLMNSTSKPSAITLKRVDWYFFANINIDGYYRGLNLEKSERTNDGAEGELFDSRIIDCYYPIYVSDGKHMVITSTTLKASGGSGARALHINNGINFNYSINSSNISSSGDYAIYYGSNKSLSIVDTNITGRIGKANNKAYIAISGGSLKNTGHDSCLIDNGTHLIKKEYNKRYVTKPKTKNLIKITANDGSDITNNIKDAINKLSGVGGGIVYIPTGTYRISDHIDVLNGIEIRGAVSWAHFNGYGGGTVIETSYKSNALFTLKDDSGINGLTIIYPENRNFKDPVEYPYTIKGNGKNIYVINVSIPSSWNGIDLTSKCDNHYIEHVWGDFFNRGITVGGGSSNGVIRDSHFTPNTLRNTTSNGLRRTLVNQLFLEVGPSSNEVLFNIFAFGPGTGYHFTSGASDFYAVGIAADFANFGIRLSGNAKGIIINPLLVTRGDTKIQIGSVLGETNIPPQSNHYIESNGDFNGFVEIFNFILWGNPFATALHLTGQGDLHIVSGIIENSGNPTVVVSNSLLSIIGVAFTNDTGAKFRLDRGINNVFMAGNVCDNMTSCSKHLINNSGKNYGNVEPKINCIR